MRVFTIGFTKKSAQKFFDLLRSSGARRVIDVRLNNVSQLAGFAKRDDLRFFLNKICDIDYIHIPELAPTQDILNDYRKKHKDWSRYETEFLELMKSRRIEETIPKETLADGCLLCSEEKPHNCHRRLVAEYLKDRWGDFEIKHLS